MSDEIKTVEYETWIERKDKSTDQLAVEVNAKYYQAEALANASITILADAGRDLLEIKSRLKHGEFENWMEEHLQFSRRKAADLMKLADKVADNNSLFSNVQMFADISISRVWALLSAPEEVAAEVIDEEDVSDLTVRELKEKLKEAEAKLEGVQDASKLEKEIEKLEKKVADAESKAKDAKDKLTKLKKERDSDIEAAVKEQAEEAAKEAEKKSSDKIASLEKEIQKLEAEAEDLTRKAKNAASDNFTEFRIQAKLMQTAFNECIQSIDREMDVDAERASKMAKALTDILEKQLKNL